MNETVKIALLFSGCLNLLFLALGFSLIAKKGGITYLLRKIPLQSLESKLTLMYDNPFYQDKKSHYETLPQSESDIIFLGDSITDLCEWAELFKNDRIKNRGICGDTTEGILNRLIRVIESKPQKLFLMIGINDLNGGRKLTDILNSYRIISETIKNKTPATQVFIQSVLPVNAKLFQKYNEKIISLNAKLKDLAQEFSFEYMDLYNYFLDSNNELDARYTTDGLHLNGQGYLIWKKIIEKDVVN